MQNALVNYNLAFMRKKEIGFKKNEINRTHRAPQGERENASGHAPATFTSACNTVQNDGFSKSRQPA